MGFFDRLEDRIERADSVLCVGLDPAPSRLPESVQNADLPRWAFNRRIIDATAHAVAAYKPNLAFYEDPAGWRALAKTLAHIEEKNVPIVLDGKRGDVGHTAAQYARLLDSERWGIDGAGPDAITVNPYLGGDAVAPFTDRPDAGIFLLCRTSNAGGADLQDQTLTSGDTVYERVADLASEWNDHDNIGLVVGATAPEELDRIRTRVPSMPFLVPGVGAQSGDVAAAVEHGLADGIGLINASRSIIFAGEEASGAFDAAAGVAAEDLRARLNTYR